MLPNCQLKSKLCGSGYDMTGESGDCKVNPNNQSRERERELVGGREGGDGSRTVRAIHEDWERA